MTRQTHLAPTSPWVTELMPLSPLNQEFALWRNLCEPWQSVELRPTLVVSPEHRSPASWLCPHWCPGPRGQWNSKDSLPTQWKVSVHTSPEPRPKWAAPGVDTAAPHCSSLHTTWAVARSRSISHKVPHVSPRRTSRRPTQGCSPPASRTSVCPGEDKLSVSIVLTGTAELRYTQDTQEAPTAATS